MLQRHTLETISRQLDASGEEEIPVCLAGWENRDADGKYLTVELSPYFQKKNKAPADEHTDSLLFFDE